MRIIYSKNYFQRDLYVLEYQNQFLMVYRGSGLNGGRVGKFLPFSFLATPSRATFNAPTPGYIYKEFFFEGHFQYHAKYPEKFGDGIEELLLKIEQELKNDSPDVVDYSHVEKYSQLTPIAAKINAEMLLAIETLKPFDWATIKDLQC